MNDDQKEPWAPQDLGRVLCEAGVWEDETPRIEAAGDGNINWVRRVRSSSGRTVIVKHARPALEKFPEYETSPERIVFEHRYFEIARQHDPDGVCPKILHFDATRHLLVLEDLASAERLDSALARGADPSEALLTLLAFLGRVHGATTSQEDLAERFDNRDIQRLHGDHIFALPYQGDGFPVPDGAEDAAKRAREDESLASVAGLAYGRYRQPRGALLHGDVQPGNILLRADGPTLLDAEIAHVGTPAFDVGCLLAHVWLHRVASASTTRLTSDTEGLWDSYRTALGRAEAVPFSAVARYAGLEIMRRSIGAARVAALASAEATIRAIDFARPLIVRPPNTPEEVRF